MLRPFGVTSETVHISGLSDAKGYKRAKFEEVWEAYLTAQNDAARQATVSEASKRPNADGTGTFCTFPKRPNSFQDGSKNGKLAYSRSGLDAWTDRKAKVGREASFGPSDLDAAAEESPSDRGVIVANGFAINHSPEDRKPLAPGQLTARVWIRPSEHPPFPGPPSRQPGDFADLKDWYAPSRRRHHPG